MTGQNLEENLCPACGVPVYPAEAQAAGKPLMNDWDQIDLFKFVLKI